MSSTDIETHQPERLSDRVYASLQWLLPTRLLSHAMHLIAGSRRAWVKRPLIGLFSRLYAINLQEAAISDTRDYASFNAFFTRALRPDARPQADTPDTLTSPVDGQIGACGNITEGRLMQAKGAAYSVTDLLRSATAAAPFLGGSYATIYLAPHNYHRVHMPITGTLRSTHYLPGRLFGVNPTSVRSIPRLFTRNERLACLFETPIGPMATILVSAFCVGGIETVWSGPVSPPHWRRMKTQTFSNADSDHIELEQGAELGRFNLGSTVILLFGDGALEWQREVGLGRTVQMGQPLANLTYGM